LFHKQTDDWACGFHASMPFLLLAADISNRIADAVEAGNIHDPENLFIRSLQRSLSQFRRVRHFRSPASLEQLLPLPGTQIDQLKIWEVVDDYAAKFTEEMKKSAKDNLRFKYKVRTCSFKLFIKSNCCKYLVACN
jgi:hypothetical protein